MKTIYKFLTLLALLAFLVMPTGSVLAKGLEDGKVVFGGSYTLESGDTLSGDLVIFGGAADVQTDATVQGNVVVMGGSIQIDGTVEHDVVIVGGTVSLGSNALVKGDVVTVGGSLQQAEGAKIRGQVINTPASMFNIGNVSNGSSILPLFNTPLAPQPPHFDFNINPLRAALNIFGQALLMTLLAALVVAFIPVPTQRVAQAVATQPVVAGGLGCMTVIIAPVILIFLGLLTLTVILAPLTVSLIGLGAILLAVALIFGEIAIGFEVGQRLIKSFHTEWPLPLSAALGTFLTVLVANAVASLLWCFGWWAPILLAMLSIGGVIMTRFGTRVALPPVAPVSGPIAPAAPANPPDAPLPPTG